MRDPWIDKDGNSYEKSAIDKWLSMKNTSPMTCNPLFPEDLIPNRVLKDLIDEFINFPDIVPDIVPAIVPDKIIPIIVPIVASLSRKPLLLYAVIDNSGSMGESCGNIASGEDDGFNRLDLVKHTLNTIITSLSPEDKICIIKFSNVAETFAPLTALTDLNKKLLIERLKHLQPEYSTNIWDGLRAALDLISKLPASDAHNVEIFLLTDGVPNINPPRPIVETVQMYMKKHCTHYRPKMHTFGYGYSLESPMLYELSKACDGCFGFIPDSSMVGTVFINALSHSLVGADALLATDTAICEVGGRFVALLREILSRFAANSQAELHDLVQRFVVTVEADLIERNAAGTAGARATEFMQALLVDCKASEDANLGQVMKAIEPAFFAKWGKHYLYSVLSAYENKVCINFKDKAMQAFRSEPFKAEQERVEDVFLHLAPPKPSIGRREPYSSSNSGYGGGGGGGAGYVSSAPSAASAPAMRTYHNAGGGCFTGDSLVLLATAAGTDDAATGAAATGGAAGCTAVQVRQLRAGDLVHSHLGVSEVECVVLLRYNGPVYQVEQMTLTAYHPVSLHADLSASFFPGDFDHCSQHLDGYVYDVVLRNRGAIASPASLHWNSDTTTSPTSPSSTTTTTSSTSGTRCLYAATFGHCVTKGVFAHAYFGSERVVEDLKRHPAWGSGRVVLSDYAFLRADDAQQCVVGLRFPTQAPSTDGDGTAAAADGATAVDDVAGGAVVACC